MLCSTRACAVAYGNGERRQHSGPNDVSSSPTLATHMLPFRRTENDIGSGAECAPAQASRSSLFRLILDDEEECML